MKKYFLVLLAVALLIALGSCRRTASEDFDFGDADIDVYGDSEKQENPAEKKNDGEDSSPEAGKKKTYKVQFVGIGGAPIATVEVEEGADAVAPEPPETEGYRFLNWDRDFTDIQADRIVTAVYEKLAQDDPSRLRFRSNGNGTCDVVGIGSFVGSVLLIPETSPEGDRVVSIAESAFTNKTFLREVVIPATVKTVEKSAFNGCYLLNKVTFLGDFDSSEEKSFNDCPTLYQVVIGDEIDELTSDGFNLLKGLKNSLVSLTLGKKLAYIEDGLFEEFYKLLEVKNNSKDLEIEVGSTENGGVGLYLLEDADGGDHVLKEQDGFLFYVNEEKEEYYLVGALDGAFQDANLEEAGEWDENEETAYRLPESCQCGGEGYYSVFKYAFNKVSRIYGLYIPETVTEIQEYAFASEKKLTFVFFEYENLLLDSQPDYQIQSYAFYECNGVKTIEVEGRRPECANEEGGWWVSDHGRIFIVEEDPA